MLYASIDNLSLSDREDTQELLNTMKTKQNQRPVKRKHNDIMITEEEKIHLGRKEMKIKDKTPPFIIIKSFKKNDMTNL